ncbi:hypothetical protein [Streptomyces sp. SYP-A7185]|uniref:hypothetical protein n=1 Tax=Streptomyces sp. SYP-A7185 TaxID=3040076 RepID=UPI0038F7AB91
MRNMHKAAIAVAGTVSALAALVPAAGASAPAEEVPEVATSQEVAGSVEVGDGAEIQSCYGGTYWGHRARVKCGSHVLKVNWNAHQDRTVDEVFAVGASRKIYHIWKNSGGWKEMPNSGRAVDTVHAYWGHGGRTVVVRAADGTHWRSTYKSNAWRGWYAA